MQIVPNINAKHSFLAFCPNQKKKKKSVTGDKNGKNLLWKELIEPGHYDNVVPVLMKSRPSAGSF